MVFFIFSRSSTSKMKNCWINWKKNFFRIIVFIYIYFCCGGILCASSICWSVVVVAAYLKFYQGKRFNTVSIRIIKKERKKKRIMKILQLKIIIYVSYKHIHTYKNPFREIVFVVGVIYISYAHDNRKFEFCYDM